LASIIAANNNNVASVVEFSAAGVVSSGPMYNVDTL
jgi:hypothetical protein